MPRFSRNTGICICASFFSGSLRDEIKLNCTPRKAGSSHLKPIKPISRVNLVLTYLIRNSSLLLLLLKELFLVPKFYHCHQESQYEMLSINVVTFCWSWNVNITRFNLIFLLSCSEWCTACKWFWSWGLNNWRWIEKDGYENHTMMMMAIMIMNIRTKGISFGLATDGCTISHLVKLSSCNSRFRGKILSVIAQQIDSDHPWAILLFYDTHDISIWCNISRYFHDIFQPVNWSKICLVSTKICPGSI